MSNDNFLQRLTFDIEIDQTDHFEKTNDFFKNLFYQKLQDEIDEILEEYKFLNLRIDHIELDLGEIDLEFDSISSIINSFTIQLLEEINQYKDEHQSEHFKGVLYLVEFLNSGYYPWGIRSKKEFYSRIISSSYSKLELKKIKKVVSVNSNARKRWLQLVKDYQFWNQLTSYRLEHPLNYSPNEVHFFIEDLIEIDEITISVASKVQKAVLSKRKQEVFFEGSLLLSTFIETGSIQSLEKAYTSIELNEQLMSYQKAHPYDFITQILEVDEKNKVKMFRTLSVIQNNVLKDIVTKKGNKAHLLLIKSFKRVVDSNSQLSIRKDLYDLISYKKILHSEFKKTLSQKELLWDVIQTLAYYKSMSSAAYLFNSFTLSVLELSDILSFHILEELYTEHILFNSNLLKQLQKHQPKIDSITESSLIEKEQELDHIDGSNKEYLKDHTTKFITDDYLEEDRSKHITNELKGFDKAVKTLLSSDRILSHWASLIGQNTLLKTIDTRAIKDELMFLSGFVELNQTINLSDSNFWKSNKAKSFWEALGVFLKENSKGNFNKVVVALLSLLKREELLTYLIFYKAIEGIGLAQVKIFRSYLLELVFNSIKPVYSTLIVELIKTIYWERDLVEHKEVFYAYKDQIEFLMFHPVSFRVLKESKIKKILKLVGSYNESKEEVDEYSTNQEEDRTIEHKKVHLKLDIGSPIDEKRITKDDQSIKSIKTENLTKGLDPSSEEGLKEASTTDSRDATGPSNKSFSESTTPSNQVKNEEVSFELELIDPIKLFYKKLALEQKESNSDFYVSLEEDYFEKLLEYTNENNQFRNEDDSIIQFDNLDQILESVHSLQLFLKDNTGNTELLLAFAKISLGEKTQYKFKLLVESENKLITTTEDYLINLQLSYGFSVFSIESFKESLRSILVDQLSVINEFSEFNVEEFVLIVLDKWLRIRKINFKRTREVIEVIGNNKSIRRPFEIVLNRNFKTSINKNIRDDLFKKQLSHYVLMHDKLPFWANSTSYTNEDAYVYFLHRLKDNDNEFIDELFTVDNTKHTLLEKIVKESIEVQLQLIELINRPLLINSHFSDVYKALLSSEYISHFVDDLELVELFIGTEIKNKNSLLNLLEFVYVGLSKVKLNVPYDKFEIELTSKLSWFTNYTTNKIAEFNSDQLEWMISYYIETSKKHPKLEPISKRKWESIIKDTLSKNEVEFDKYIKKHVSSKISMERIISIFGIQDFLEKLSHWIENLSLERKLIIDLYVKYLQSESIDESSQIVFVRKSLEGINIKSDSAFVQKSLDIWKHLPTKLKISFISFLNKYPIETIPIDQIRVKIKLFVQDSITRLAVSSDKKEVGVDTTDTATEHRPAKDSEQRDQNILESNKEKDLILDDNKNLNDKGHKESEQDKFVYDKEYKSEQVRRTNDSILGYRNEMFDKESSKFMFEVVEYFVEIGALRRDFQNFNEKQLNYFFKELIKNETLLLKKALYDWSKNAIYVRRVLKLVDNENKKLLLNVVHKDLHSKLLSYKELISIVFGDDQFWSSLGFDLIDELIVFVYKNWSQTDLVLSSSMYFVFALNETVLKRKGMPISVLFNKLRILKLEEKLIKSIFYKEFILGLEKRIKISQNNQTEEFSEELDKGNSISIQNSGLVILWPYLFRLFDKLGLIENKQIIPEEIDKTIVLSHFLVYGDQPYDENMLLLNKILCGVKEASYVSEFIQLTEFEKDICNSLLKSVVHNWEKLSSTSIDTFRTTFLQREGVLSRQVPNYSLHVEHKPYDILMDTLPWNISMIQTVFMKNRLLVEWKTK